jgi:hypothetical protein
LMIISSMIFLTIPVIWMQLSTSLILVLTIIGITHWFSALISVHA